VRAKPEAILQSFVAHEARIEAGVWKPYREVLREVLIGMAVDFKIALADAEPYLLAESLAHWPPFADTVNALQQLSNKFHLVIVSNTDDALFAATRQQLGVRFDEVITAEQVKSYKPGRVHFEEALRRLQVPVSQVMHVAQSLYHDHVPARGLGS
jgi:2-haloacid dehalogenase